MKASPVSRELSLASVRLSDKDETNNLELYCYTYCDNNSPEE